MLTVPRSGLGLTPPSAPRLSRVPLINAASLLLAALLLAWLLSRLVPAVLVPSGSSGSSGGDDDQASRGAKLPLPATVPRARARGEDDGWDRRAQEERAECARKTDEVMRELARVSERLVRAEREVERLKKAACSGEATMAATTATTPARIPPTWCELKLRVSVPDDDALWTHLAAVRTLTNGKPAFVMYLDGSFADMTKSWICNVERMGVLPRVVFVATDRAAFEQISAFREGLRVVLVPYEPVGKQQNQPMAYGQVAYYDYARFRAGLTLQILMHGYDAIPIESDAVWHADPLPDFLASDADIVSGNDRTPADPLLSHGFALFRSRPALVDFLVAAAVRQQSFFSQTGDAGNEQLHWQDMLRGEFRDRVRVSFLDQEKYVNGQRFSDRSPRIVVRQNNWITGNAAKVARAKAEGWWFVRDDGSCVLAA